MTTSESTCWTMIRGAAAGDPRQRACFATRYIPTVRAYLAARWRCTPHHREIDDAIQEVFLECYRKGGVLERVEPDCGGGFRPFLFGVVRNVALRFEGREGRMTMRHPPGSPNPDKIVRSDRGLS